MENKKGEGRDREAAHPMIFARHKEREEIESSSSRPEGGKQRERQYLIVPLPS